ncbi:uncharacterized protein LOC106089485 [Stomoxys calcitrans]|uniref:uncharacterized protein LOC106089485 n=1 Tax=Stomoxys calcitrans TaxID=35570 RepID=UPI0027E24C32|nr:uncharacterized protein LOC106089485 [Stomoxys calcitrans]
MKFILVAILLLLNISQSFHMEMSDGEDETDMYTFGENYDISPEELSEIPRHRAKRGIWDFFQKMVITKNLIVEQYTDTKDTLNEVFTMFNSQFSDTPNATPRSTEVTTPKSSSEDTTDSSEVKSTTERFSISRYDFGRILGRNFRGLRRLTEIEFRDALNATHYNIADYKAEANKQFANSLAAEKKKQIKALVRG